MYTQEFDIAVDFTLALEGSTNYYVEDRGGLTKYGISSKQYPDLDIASLTIAQAKEIYHRDYWCKAGCDEMDLPLAVTVFDTAVNCGVNSACVWLQKVLGVSVDGVVGTQTLRACSLRNEYDTSSKVLALRLQRYKKLVKRNPTQRIFVLGWMNRVSKILLFI